ncbi:hypothetical protein ACHAXR_012673 [Thalassiosira sp. AJA248-18]
MAAGRRGANGLSIFGGRERMPHAKGTSRGGRARLSYLFLLSSFAIFFQLGFMLARQILAVTLSYSAMGIVQSESNDSSVWLPDGWETYSFSETRRHFGCKAYAHDQTKPLLSMQDWKLFQSKYRDIVDETATFDDPVPPTMGYTLGDGGPPPYYAKHSPEGRGRGLFASRDIKKGELTHDGTNSDIMFPDAMAWRRYIFSLPRNRACDMVDWTWTQQSDEDGEFHIFSAINISVLHNGATEAANVNPTSSTSSKFYATRDINRGEELLTDYGWYDTVWDDVGLGKRHD